MNENVCVPVALSVVGDAAIYAGNAHVMLPIPVPEPENVQVVVVQLTPGPENVKAPAVLFMLVTPPPLGLIYSHALPDQCMYPAVAGAGMR